VHKTLNVKLIKNMMKNILLVMSLLRIALSENVVDISSKDDLVVQPLPFDSGPSMNSKDGTTFGADSSSFTIDGKAVLYAAGEIHMGRTPQSQWKEQLMRMKSGGLDMVDVYFFWIHHEETENEFNFTGRRNVTLFLQTGTFFFFNSTLERENITLLHTAKEVGLKVLARIGPWDHGEVRNGGHPDWILEKAQEEGFALRNNNPKYMGYVERWYANLARMMNTLFWKDGGRMCFCFFFSLPTLTLSTHPINPTNLAVVAVQVDNETSDWKYLLALSSLAKSLGIEPTFYTKTGW